MNKKKNEAKTNEKEEPKKKRKILLIFVPFFSPLTNCSHISLVCYIYIYIYRLVVRIEREEEDKEDGIGGRRGDFDHARVFVLRE